MLTATNSDISSCQIQSNRLLSGGSLDLVVLSQDINNSDEDDLLKTEILATVRSGKVEYSANEDLFKESCQL